MAKRRYVARLRAEGIGENDPIDIYELYYGNVATFDTVENRFLTDKDLADPAIRRAIATGAG